MWLIFSSLVFPIQRKSLCVLLLILVFITGLVLIGFPFRIGMVRMDTVDLSSGSEVYTPDVEEVSLFVSLAW